MSSIDLREVIRRARDGDQSAVNELFKELRPLLRRRADHRLPPAIRGRLDASDLVQQTLLEATRDLERFTGSTGEELWAWLGTALERNAVEAVRAHLLAARRACGEERPLDDAAAGLAERLAAPGGTPSQAVATRQLGLRLLEALERLPAEQRQAVRLRHVDGHSLAEIATQLGRSETAVAGLIKRGLASLRRRGDLDE